MKKKKPIHKEIIVFRDCGDVSIDVYHNGVWNHRLTLPLNLAKELIPKLEAVVGKEKQDA